MTRCYFRKIWALKVIYVKMNPVAEFDSLATSHALKDKYPSEKEVKQINAEVSSHETSSARECSTDHAEYPHPTEEELATLRRVSGPIPWTAFSIAFVEFCERFSYYGTTAVFVNFIQQPLPEGSNTGAGFDGQSGALGMGQRAR